MTNQKKQLRLEHHLLAKTQQLEKQEWQQIGSEMTNITNDMSSLHENDL